MPEGMGNGPQGRPRGPPRGMGRFRRSDEAAAGVVSIMLAILVVIILMTMVTTLWIPEWMENVESDHMNQVNSQFDNMKSSIDKQILSGDTKFVIGNPLTLGTQSTSVFGSDSAGTFSINSFRDDDLEYYCNVRNQSGELNITCTGGMKYASNNVRFVDQGLAYENGAIILNQGEGEILRSRPQFLAEKNGPVVHLSYVLITVSGLEASMTGSGTIIVETQLVTYTTAEYSFRNPEWFYISMVSEYPTAWARFYNNTLIEAGLTPVADFTTTVSGSDITVAIRNVNSFNMGYALITVEIQDQAGGSSTVTGLQDVIGLWHFNSGVGTTAIDSSPLHNNGVLVGDANWSAGVRGQGIYFDGSGDRVEVPEVSAYNVGDGITVMAWVRWSVDPKTGTAWASIVSKGENQWVLMHNGNASGPALFNSYFEFAVRTNATRDWVWSTTETAANIWYHVAGVFDGTSHELRIYVNGSLENSTVLNGTINVVAQGLTFGAQYHLGSYRRHFEGDIDEIYIFDRALSDLDIARYYQMLKP